MERLNFSHQNPFPKSGVLKLERLLVAWGGIEQKPGTLLYIVKSLSTDDDDSDGDYCKTQKICRYQSKKFDIY